MRASRYQLLPAVTKGSLVTVRAVSLPLLIGNDHQHRIMTATPDDWEEMTEEQANREGVFDCPTCGRLRNASELTPEEADEWAASRGVKIVRT